MLRSPWGSKNQMGLQLMSASTGRVLAGSCGVRGWCPEWIWGRSVFLPGVQGGSGGWNRLWEARGGSWASLGESSGALGEVLRSPGVPRGSFLVGLGRVMWGPRGCPGWVWGILEAMYHLTGFMD